MKNCPCDLQCREECEICKSEYDMKIAMERIDKKPPIDSERLFKNELTTESD